ncbi:substrate-binding domain-containing protein [Agathobaculum sp. NTUH-O15-33]|uniref:substrate-binding domain-containing protein n=1 Tax=Agathobaculum sp. NTUH-O15-33 TaxID=3079302 RepID=UPI0029584C1C|nr:substrate-binding domain-containing protein [Agathobaculum sp. NTUH-O15-33]WNX83324.1 substrate-binding domain-containing protein [Agathobaculum sp. NTUH-O15-33]
MKKRFALIMAGFTLVSGLAGCTGGETNADGNEEVRSDGAEKLVIGFSQDKNDIDWTQSMKEDIQATCEENDVELTITDANGSGEKAASDIEDLITLGVDAIIVQTYHADTIANAVQDAVDAGIPVIALSSEIPGANVTSLITVDATETGRMMGEYVQNKFPDGAYIVQLTGKEGSLVNVNRGVGFHEIIDANTKFTVLSELSCNYERSKAMTAMEDQLQAHGDKIQVVYCHNDDMALGAIQAIESMGYTADIDHGICVVSAADGMIPEVLDNVENGKMVSGYFPTFGKEGVETALKAIRGEAVEAKILVPSEVITTENVDHYRR